MYRKDFIIYREPNVSPSQVTENNFPEKVLLCFSNGNHYDIVYPIKYKESSAMCQSLLYELLYEKVFKTDVSKILMGLDTSEVADENNSEISDSEDDSCKSKTTAVNDVYGFKALSSDQHPKSNGNSPSLPLSRKVLKSLNPAVYRNVEYEIWLKSKQAQQKHDYSIAAGLQYEVGDKCQVRLEHNGRFSNADFQGVHSQNGPVLVEELGKKHSPKNLKPPPSESWNTVSGKKMKKPPSGQNFHSDVDFRGPKNPSKPIKAPSALPPRFQHPSGVRQHAFSSHYAGLQSQKPSSEHKNLSRTPSQMIRHSPKNLKPPPSESWNTVSGKKMKKPPSGQNFHSDVDFRGPKNPSKPIKAPSALPPRFQHPSGVRQHAFSSHYAGLQSQKPSSEHKNLSRTPSQMIRNGLDKWK